MSWWARAGLRTRLAVALVGVALISLAVATVLANQGLRSRLSQSARERLVSAAGHTADLAGSLYVQQGGRWDARTLADLDHLAGITGYRVAVYDAAGRRLAGSQPRSAAAIARAGVLVGSRPVGTIVVALSQGQLLSAEDHRLEGRIEDLHLLAAALALVVGLAAAIAIAPRIARPLRALTDAARRIESGELRARVTPAGTPETAAVGRAFNRLAETLEHEERIRRDAAADVAHELRTPLAGILSRIEAAQDGVLSDERANLTAMHTDALRLTRLVEDLGRLAEAQQPGLSLKKEPLDLRALVHERASLHRDNLRAKGIELHERLEPAHAYGDPGRIGQILDNLLSNALRYTDAGGTVTVSLGERDDEALLEVTDTGVGIAGEDLPYIFERFWRGESSRTRRSGGAGIGLAIVRELVRAHDGRIDVQSTPGEGSRFTVTLPASHSPSRESEAGLHTVFTECGNTQRKGDRE